MSIELKTLPNGLRIITEEVPTVETAAVGLWAGVGTRNEDLTFNGAAHMVEHMLFKGTPSRSAQDIAEQIENVGGHMNAYTSREITSYHVHLLKEDVRLGLDVLSDMMTNALLPEEEVERERHVILQEIGMTYDTPDDYIFDMYQMAAYPGQGLGAPILGNAEIISNMKRDALQAYIDAHYHTGNVVVAVAGNIRHQDVQDMAADMLGGLRQGETEQYPPADYKGGDTRQERPLEQSHIVLGFRGIPKTDDRFMAASVLATLTGGGLSSRLFQEIRERRGLVYSIFSAHSGYYDDGQFEIYAGTGPDKLPELVPVLCDEVLRLSQDITEEELARAKAQRRSSLLMSRESMMHRTDRLAKHLITFGKKFDIRDELDRLNAVSVLDVKNAAKTIFSAKPTLAALGPLEQLEPYETTEKRIAA